MPNPDIWKHAVKGGATRRGVRQSPEHVARRTEAARRAIAQLRRSCRECGKLFGPTNSKQRYCSTRCCDAVQNRNRPPGKRVLGLANPLRGRAQSPEHVQRRQESARRTMESVQRDCVVCMQPFTRTGAAQKYCSGKCWNVVARKRKARKQGIACPPELYAELAEKQGHKCAICAAPTGSNARKDRLAVDHHHGTGRVRGLLCHRCNTAIGLLRDNAEIITRAAAYVVAPPFDVAIPVVEEAMQSPR